MKSNVLFFITLALFVNICAFAQEGSDAICDADDRVASVDPAVGRIIFTYSPYVEQNLCATGFIIANGKIVTAGHVIAELIQEGDWLEFNVKPSLPNGQLQYSDPEDKYMIDMNSFSWQYEGSGSGGYGKDWAVFSVFPNQITGLTPIEAQQSYKISKKTYTPGSIIRITGYGKDDGTYNHLQQTATGSYEGYGPQSNFFKYKTDTESGNSGSPIIEESTGFVIGVHCQGLCDTYQYNGGTSFTNTNFWNAVNLGDIVTIDQKRESGSRLTGTNISHYETRFVTDEFLDYQIASGSGIPFQFNKNKIETFKGLQELVDSPSEKYYQWNNLNNVTNHKSFLLDNIITEFVSNFKQVYSNVTIKNEYPEVSGLNPTYDNIDFKDPWLIDYPDPNFPKPTGGYYLRNRGMKQSGNDALIFKSRPSPFTPDYSTNYNGDIYKGIFLNQNPTFDPNLPIYSIRSQVQDVFLSQTNRWHKFFCYEWTGTNINFQYPKSNETAIVFTNDNATVIAKLKGTQISNTLTAYANPNQRRFVRSSGGYLHMVYESMGKIWYERKFGESGTWEIMNGGKPLNDGLGKYPSIDYLPSYYGYDQVVIVYWEDSFTEPFGTKLIVKYFDFSYSVPVILKGVVATANELTVDELSVPVVSISQGGFILVAWNYGNIVYRLGRPGYTNNTINWDTPPTYINWGGGFGVNLRNPTIASPKGGTANSYWIAWDENNSKIKFMNLAVNYNSQSGYYITEGNGFTYGQAGFSMNYQPSISVTPNNDYRISWFGENYLDGIGQKQVVTYFNFQFYIFGTNVSSHSIRTTDDGKAIIAYGDQSGTRNKFRQVWYWGSEKNLGTTGKQTHLSNGSNTNFMYAMSFQNATLPYSFSMSASLGSLQKVTEIPIASGRKGIVVGDSAEFYFTLGDVALNGNNIDFIQTGINPDFTNLDTLNYYLSTEKFNVTNSSHFNFSIEFGVTDSLKAVQSLAEDEYVKFKLQLINANTNQLMGEYTVVTFTKQNVIPYYGKSFSINTNGIGNKKVRVRIVVEENIGGSYAMANISAEENVLPKQNQNVISYSGSEVVSEYALEQNYPNPFNPTTTIKYQIPSSGNVTIKVYDILGNEVAKLVDGYMETGKYEVEFDASSLASGVYIYRLSVNDFVNVKKMVMLK